MEVGQPLGNQCEIDILLHVDEIVKRLERRMIAKIDEMQINILQNLTSSPETTKESVTTSESSPPSSPRKVRKISRPKPPLEPNMDLLKHNVQDMVQDIVTTSMERVIDTAMVDDGRKELQKSGTVFQPSGAIYEAKKAPGAKLGEGPMTRYDRNITRPIPFKRNGSLYPMKAITTPTLKPKSPKAPQERVLGTGYNKKLPERLGEKDQNINTNYTYALRNSPKSPQEKVLSTGCNKKLLESLGEKDQNINTNYTYALRNSVKRALPKYLQQDGAAMMNMFNAIRFAMAEDSIESVVAEALVKAFSRDDAERKGSMKSEEQNIMKTSGPCKTPADGGQTFPWSNREQDYGSLGQDVVDGYAQQEKRVTFKAGETDAATSKRKMNVLGRLGEDHNINTNYTYALRNSVKRTIPKYLQQDGGQSKGAVMNMFNSIRLAMAEDSIEDSMTKALEEAFSGGLREKAGTKTSGPGGCFDTYESNRRPDYGSLEQDMDGYAQHKKRVTFKTGETDAATSNWKRNVLDRLGGEDHNINTNYTYTLRSSVRRAIPKYLQQDGGQSKAAMMNMFNAIRLAMAEDSIESTMAAALEKAF